MPHIPSQPLQTPPILNASRSDSVLNHLDSNSLVSTSESKVSPSDEAKLSKSGSAQTSLALDNPPSWSESTKKGIASSFKKGLAQYNTSPQELTEILKSTGISSLELTEENITNPANSKEIEKIQDILDKRLNTTAIKRLGGGKSMTIDGQFGKNSVQALKAIQTLQRGDGISLNISPIRQKTKTGCFRTSEAMMFNAIHHKEGKSDAYTEFDIRDRIKVVDRDKHQLNIIQSENSRGRVTVNREKAVKLLTTLDQELDAGRPVIGGVSYRKQNGHEYNEGVTDHFVTIVGRGHDEEGLFYQFNDPAGGKDHKLRLDPISGKLSGKGDMSGTYDLTLISWAKSTEPETISHYEKLGKTLFYQGQRSPEIKDMQFKLSAMGFDTNGASGAYGNGTFGAVKAFQETYRLPVTGSSVDNYTMESIDRAFAEWQPQALDVVLFKKGDNSALLVALQKQLTNLGFDTGGSKGQFGPMTEKALQAFQEVNQLPVTGVIDNQTWLKIQALS